MKSSVSKKLTALVLACAVWFGMSATMGTVTANAAENEAMKAGDHVKMGVASDEYVGTPEWTVLDVMDDNEDGTPDRAYLVSTYLWKDKTGEDTMIFGNGGSSKWDGSNAKAWCEKFYTNVLKKSELVATTDINDPKDGNFPAVESKGNKVFFLSHADVMNEKYFKDDAARKAEVPGEGKAMYWTRTPGSIPGRVVTIQETGRKFAGGNVIDNRVKMRPAMYLDLHSDACVQRTEAEGAVTWEYDVENTAHTYAEPTYTWSENHSVCTAATTCTKCGAALSEEGKIFAEVTKEATTAEEGNTCYTATFENDAFSPQVKNVPIAKLPAKPIVKPANKGLKNGGKYTAAGASYKVISAKACTVALVKAKNTKSVSIPATVKIYGKSCKVVQVKAKAFTGKKIRKVTVGKNVKKLDKYAFAKSKATTVVLKTKSLKKSTVKGCFKSSKVKTGQVKVGTKKQNKKMVKTYKKMFTKKNCGKKVKVK